MLFDLKVGQHISPQGTRLVVKKAEHDEKGHALCYTPENEKCYFFSDDECSICKNLHYHCFAEDRSDNTDVVFVKQQKIIENE